MKRILLTYTLAFILLPVYGGEGGSSPAEKKSLLIMLILLSGQQILALPIREQFARTG